MGTFRTTRGLHNKSLGCGASGAYALGPDEKKKKKNVKRLERGGGWGGGLQKE